MITKMFINPLLSRVFKFIDEKQAMDSKRKTWNLKHQVEQVEDLKRQKNNWEYHTSKKSSLQSRMKAIFQEHEIESGNFEEHDSIQANKSADHKQDD